MEPGLVKPGHGGGCAALQGGNKAVPNAVPPAKEPSTSFGIWMGIRREHWRRELRNAVQHGPPSHSSLAELRAMLCPSCSADPARARRWEGERTSKSPLWWPPLLQTINNESHLSRLQTEGYSIARGGKPSRSRWQES